MPSRKKDRGKQRKAAKQSSNGLAGRASPMGAQTQRQRYIRSEIKEFMAEGCSVVLRDNGSCSTISHPCFKHVKDELPGVGGKSRAALDTVKEFDRGLLTDEGMQELAENYVRNFAQDLREGDYYGTQVIMRNIADPHFGRKLEDELLKADIHLSLLHFLNQSAKSSSDVLGRVVGARESTMLAYYWVVILGILMQDGSALDARDGARLAVAKGIEPFLMSVIDDKREMFQSNHVWHLCIAPFFELMQETLKSKEGFSVMRSHEGFLPFVAQASCWSQSREDIASESESLRRLYPDPSPDPLSLTVRKAQKILAVAIHEHYYAEQEDVMREALDQIACTPLLSNNPECNDSTTVGFIRMMSNDKSVDRSFLFELIIEPLLLKHGYVDAGVISELIEYGKGNSVVATETVLFTMVAILGRDDDFAHIKRIDSRCAAAVRCGLLEFCIDALVAYGDGTGNEIGDGIGYLAHTLCASMAMHSKTSRALRERKAQIMAALDVLRNYSTASRSNVICTLINDAVEASSCATCCNCLTEVDRNELLYCKRCGVECYCSADCQSESYGLGHDVLCKKEAHRSSELKEKGLSETELKRIAVLGNNLMMNGCRLVREKTAEILDEERNVAEVTIDFGEYPPEIKVSRDDTGECSGSGNLKCTFTAPVYYGFVEKVDLGEVVIEKFIARRSLAEPVTATSDYDGVD